jgi:hypothetical protein
MRLTRLVFDALTPGPATRAELEERTGLPSVSVRECLRALARHRVLVVDAAGLVVVPYALVDGATPPADGRGRHARSAEFRATQRARELERRGRCCVVPHYQAAKPPSHAAAPGVLRVGVRAHGAAPGGFTDRIGRRR